MSSSELEHQMDAVKESWKRFFAGVKKQTKDKQEFENIEYTVNTAALRELVERVDQRKDYFARYHSGMKMSEFKEIGLNMFWLAKLKPFSIKGAENTDAYTFDINEDFAMYHMLSALQTMAKDLNTPFIEEKISSALYYEISYCLSFRDMSKEAIGLLVELVARIVIPDFDQKEKERAAQEK